MSRFVIYISVLVTVCCMLFGSAKAQQVACANATAMQNVNLTQFTGSWYLVARNPIEANMGCTEVVLGLHSDNQTLGINVTFVDTKQSKWVNSTATANITLSSSNTNGYYNVTLSIGGKNQTTKTLKLLTTDYKNYAIICGYTNASDASTAFGAVLTRVRIPIAANLTSYEEMASKNYTNFSNMTLITQSAKCYRSSASTQLPMISTIFAAIYVLFKFIF